MRKMLINLTRFGDLLQTQPLIDGLKKEGHDLALICLENFAPAASLLQGLEQISALPGSALLAKSKEDWPLALAQLQAWLQREQEKFSPDQILNLTPTISARLLSRLLSPHSAAQGFSLDEYGFGLDSSIWASYVQAASLKRGCSPFNLVDAFRYMAGLEHIPPSYALSLPKPDQREQIREKIAAALGKQKLPQPKAFIGLQLGASAEIRRWPTAYFAQVGQKLYQEQGLLPIILGSKDEAGLAEEYFDQAPGLNFCGQTNLPQLAALLLECRLLLSNDTGTMHLAAGLNIPILAIFLATAQAWDTGPYQAGNCCLEPRLDCHPCGFSSNCAQNQLCRQIIQPQTVINLISAWLESGQWPQTDQAKPDSPAKQARIWLSGFDAYGCMDLRSLSGDEKSDRSLWIGLQKYFYRRLLTALEEEPAEARPQAGQEGDPARNLLQKQGASQSLQEDPRLAGLKSKQNSGPSKQPDPASRPSALREEEEALAQAAGLELSAQFKQELEDFLQQSSALLLLAREQTRLLNLRPGQASSQALLATCNKIELFWQQSPHFIPLAQLWKILIQQRSSHSANLLAFLAILQSNLENLSNKIR